jgi:hypothetical protein
MLSGLCTLLGCFSGNELGNNISSELPVSGDYSVWETHREKLPQRRPVCLNGPSGITATAGKIALEALYNLIRSAHWDRSLGSDYFGFTQDEQKPVECGAICGYDAPMTHAEPQIPIYNRLIDLFNLMVLPGQPAIKVADDANVAPRTGVRMALSRKTRGERI